MLQVPADEEFKSFVTDRRDQGLSSSSIAGALNHSPWAKAGGCRWNWRQVAALCWSPDSEAIAPWRKSGADRVIADVQYVGSDRLDSMPPCTREDCEFHRRLSLLRSLLTWAPFEPDLARLIASYDAAGESAETVAARLNRDGFRAPTGAKWHAGLVRAMTRIYAPQPALTIEPASGSHAWSNVAA